MTHGKVGSSWIRRKLTKLLRDILNNGSLMLYVEAWVQTQGLQGSGRR